MPDDRFGRKVSRCVQCGRRMDSSGCPMHGQPDESMTFVMVHESKDELRQFSGYQTERVLGRGGFGTVYVAVGTEHPEQRVAIKVAHSTTPDAKRRLTRESHALQLIGPPHVPAVIDDGKLASSPPYIVMELVEGMPLADLLEANRPPLSLNDVCKIACTLLESLAAVHAKGLVHGDMKPENVLLANDFTHATILDLGLARRISAISVRESSSIPPTTMAGTLEYMSPEQCESRNLIDERADVYAVGVMLYEMLTGRVPFWGPPAFVREGHLSRRPMRMSGALELDSVGGRPSLVNGSLRQPGAPIAAALEDIVSRCLEKDPQARFATAEKLRDAIADAAKSFESSMQQPSGGPSRGYFSNGDNHSLAESVVPTLDRPPTNTPDSRRNTTERRTVSLLHFGSHLDPIALRARIEAIGGYLMRATGGRNVVAFGHDGAENPARLSLRAAQDLVERGICERVWVDLAQVSVTTRPDGAIRLLSPRLARADRALLPEGTAPIVLSPSARAVLSEADLRVVADPDGVPVVAEREFPVVEDPTTRLGYAGPPLVGRDDTLEALASCALRATRELTPSIMAVIGEAGHGKSHLRRLLVERLRSLVPAVGVLDLRARELLGGGGDCVRDLLSEALGLPPSIAPEMRRATLRERLGAASSPEAEAALALALGWIAPQGDDTTDFPGLRVLEAAPFALRATLTVVGGEALRRRAERAPLCVVLDDAHHADDATLSILEYATLAEANAPIFVCAMARPVFREIRPSWGERAARYELVELEPLDAASAAALCRALLYPAENVPESAVRRLVERTQGIPLLLVELVRGLKGAGIVRRYQGARGFYVATDEIDRVPDLPLIEWLAHREIDALSPAERAHARLVATVGVEVTTDEVSGILRGILRRLENSGDAGEFPLDARIGIDRLLGAGVLRRQRQGRVGFRHGLVREAIVRGVPEHLRRKIHLAAVEYYRDAHNRVDGLSEELRLPQLGYHAARVRQFDVAEEAYMQLAEAARARHAYVDAERFYTLVLEQSDSRLAPMLRQDEPTSTPSSSRKSEAMPSGSVHRNHRRDAYHGRALMRYRVGRNHDALLDFAEVRALTDPDAFVEHAQILLDEATALDWMADHVASREKVLAAKELAEGRATPALSARLLLAIGRSSCRFSSIEEAVTALELAATEAAALGEEGYETQVIALLLLGALAAQGISNLSNAETVLDRAISLCESHGDALHLGSSMNSRGVLRAFQGDSVRMVADFERVISLGRELGQYYLEFSGHCNLGEFLYWMDRLDEAAAHVARARAMNERWAAGGFWPETILLEARIALYRGEISKARELAQQVRGERAAPLTVPSEDVLCSMVELATSDADDAAWDALEERSSTRFSVGQERIEVIEARGMVEARRGRLDAARSHYERAADLAGQIPNALRDRILRRLVQLASMQPSRA